jgi:probable HAF family extracellular repeat protein
MNEHERLFLPRLAPKLAGALFLLSLLLAGGKAWAATYTVIDIATLLQGHPASVHGPNVAGAAVGGGVPVTGTERVGRPRGLVFANRAVRVIGGLANSDYTITFGINDAGSVVGGSNTAIAVRGFVTTAAGSTQELPPLAGDTASTAFAINNTGQAAGYSSGPDGERAVIWAANGAVTALAGGSGITVRALALNDRSDVVGVVDNGAGRRAILWPKAGTPQELGVLSNYMMSEPTGISASGNVVGFSEDASGARRATLWPSGGGIIDLGTLPGGKFSQALGINARGNIVGTSGSNSGNRAFLWTPANGLQDLNSLIGPSPLVLTAAVGINQSGMIVAIGHEATGDAHEEHEAPIRVFLLKP